MNGMMAGMGLWMLLWALAALAILVLAVFGIVWLARNSGEKTGRGTPARDDSPEEILRRRYAAGEIDEDEYLRRMSGLSR